jgi:hypothetical protein
MDWAWILWQAVVPLLAPVIVWLLVCLARSALRSTPSLASHLRTLPHVVEEHGWLVYALFLSIQSAAAIDDAAEAPGWIFWLNIGVLTISLLILAIGFLARFTDTGATVTMKPASDARINLFSAGLVAVAAAIVGYLTSSFDKVL